VSALKGSPLGGGGKGRGQEFMKSSLCLFLLTFAEEVVAAVFKAFFAGVGVNETREDGELDHFFSGVGSVSVV
jgi:hypothetical protein